ncbi:MULTISPECIES: hypothetical protein [unclassified Methanoregula]|uniref:hypothetical protein n=1 Tax=unclassified Methanoregula TaxID=2649730 RepID=UPI0009D56D6F|nr:MULTISPECIES: hypothetical protein [unclassified Methanoregula]OPX64734.1 MAG: hypothetical protein A4E33_00704 [Methanoregula sp. PtaB.Bin085]OPY35204.1 MAG: hypothetical protein A4E34_00881 [Methanoregula sp. PtaU1.Bin006]
MTDTDAAPAAAAPEIEQAEISPEHLIFYIENADEKIDADTMDACLLYLGMYILIPAEPPHIAEGTVPVKDPYREWKIVVPGRLRDQTLTALDALADVNDPPFVFVRGRNLCRVGYTRDGIPYIEELNEPALRGIIERCCDTVQMIRGGLEEKPIPPPKEVILDILNSPQWGETIHPITGIAECPTINLMDGSIREDQGYDPATGFYYAPPPGFMSPQIPDHPTKADVRAAVDLLREIFCDFPFTDEASRTNTIATLISAAIRPTIDGLVPMFILSKNQAGTGAGLVTSCISLVVTGKPASIVTAPDHDEEWRKRITALLSTGRTLALIDNVEDRIRAPSLAAVLTARQWEDRELGRSRTVSYRHTMTWITTGNNIQLGGDLGRRCYMAYMRSNSARPWQREKQWRHPHLERWVLENRSRILSAILTIVRSWVLAGRPTPSAAVPKVGGFERWRDTIGGICEHAGLPEFLWNLESMYDSVDEESRQWEAFFSRWYEIWHSRPITVADLQAQMMREEDSLNVASGSDRLADCLPDFLSDALHGKKSFSRVLGRALAKQNGRHFVSGLVFGRGDESHGVATWKLHMQKDQGGY